MPNNTFKFQVRYKGAIIACKNSIDCAHYSFMRLFAIECRIDLCGVSSLKSHVVLFIAYCIHLIPHHASKLEANAHVHFVQYGIILFRYVFQSLPGTGIIAATHTPRIAAANLVRIWQLYWL